VGYEGKAVIGSAGLFFPRCRTHSLRHLDDFLSVPALDPSTKTCCASSSKSAWPSCRLERNCASRKHSPKTSHSPGSGPSQPQRRIIRMSACSCAQAVRKTAALPRALSGEVRSEVPVSGIGRIAWRGLAAAGVWC